MTEKLAIEYAFQKLGLCPLHADAVRKNCRSIHVLEKAGFRFVREDDKYVYYEIQNPNQLSCNENEGPERA